MATAYVNVIERRRVVYKLENIHSRDDVYDTYQMGDVCEDDYMDDVILDIEFEDIEDGDDV